MNLDESLSAMSLKDTQDKSLTTSTPITAPRVMPPRPMPQRLPGRSVLPPMSRPGSSPLPPMSGSNSPVPGGLGTPPPMGGLRGRPGTGRMGKPALNLSQLGLSPKQEQTPFANFSKYV